MGHVSYWGRNDSPSCPVLCLPLDGEVASIFSAANPCLLWPPSGKGPSDGRQRFGQRGKACVDFRTGLLGCWLSPPSWQLSLWARG